MLKKLSSLIFNIVIASMLVLTTLTYFNGFINDLLSNTKFYLFLVSAIVTIISFFALKKSLTKILVTTIFLANLFAVYPMFISKQGNKTGTKISILHANLLSSNKNKSSIFDLIDKHNPDIIGLQEVSFSWEKEINKKLKHYKYRMIDAKKGNFGIALLAKLPLNNIENKKFTNLDINSIIATVSKNNKTINLCYTHPTPPISKKLFNYRNKQLLQVAQSFSNKKNALVFGDMNITPWSVWFKKFMNVAELNHSTNKILKTWPAKTILGIPIDHFFHSNDFSVANVEVLPDIGSDHKPIFIEYNVK